MLVSVRVWRPARVLELPEPQERRVPERQVLVLGLQPVREQALAPGSVREQVLVPGSVREQELASARELAWPAWVARAPAGRPVVAD